MMATIRDLDLKILLPTQILVHAPAHKVIAEAENGSFCLLPRHVDFTAALAPGILIYTDAADAEHFIATDEGILVKQGADVLVSVRDAVVGPDLGQLRATVAARFQQLDERERHARGALARLEADFVRRFLQLRE